MTTESPLTFEHGYDIRSYEPRPDGRVSVTAICNQLQDIASRHADTLGFGHRDLEQSGHFWILARLHLMVDRLPGFGGRTDILTWPSGNERLVALRDFLVLDQDGPMGRATTSWVTMNTRTHRPDPPQTVLHERFIPDREHALTFPTKAVTRLKQGEFQTRLTARRSDMDINGHVNNVKYLEYCFEAVPVEWIADNRCHGVDIQFRSEAFPGDKLVSECAMGEPDQGMDTFLHGLTRVSDNKEIVRMRSWWRRP
jgi:acyl-ACP thioesterase